MKFSLIIPCYNESKGLNLLLERCRPIAALDGHEVILVDNGSTDTTHSVLKELLPQYPGCKSIRIDINQGYGFGILSGLHAAQGEVLGWTHADLQTDPQDVLKGLQIYYQNKTACFVKGKRHGRPLGDVIFTVGMSIFETLLLRRWFWDINAQPNLFSKSFFQLWAADAPHDFSLDLYVYYMAKKNGLQIERYPVKFCERLFGTSHWNINWHAKRKFIMRTISFSFALKKKI